MRRALSLVRLASGCGFLAVLALAAVLSAARASSAGSSGGSTNSSGQAALGPSITLHQVTKRHDCRVRGPLPDPACTPGAYFRNATVARICRSGYAKQVRDVSRSTKDAVYNAYRITRHFNGRNGEVDHLISLELGGSNVQANLFPEAATPAPGSHQKDKLENRLHAEVCMGQITLRKAQREIAGNWVSVYRREFAARSQGAGGAVARRASSSYGLRAYPNLR